MKRAWWLAAALIVLGFGAHAGSQKPARPAEASENRRQTLAVLEKGVEEHPQNADLWLHLGFEYRKADDIDNAQKAFEQAARLDPRQVDAFYMLGLIYEKKGLKDQAVEAWKACAAAATQEGMRQTARNHLHLLQSTKG